MALDPLNSSNLEQLALKGLNSYVRTAKTFHKFVKSVLFFVYHLNSTCCALMTSAMKSPRPSAL